VKSDGKEYMPRSLQLSLAGLQRYLQKVRPNKDVNLFTDPRFKALRNTCDSVFIQLYRKGIGTETKATPVLKSNIEAELWKSGTLNMDTPKGLLRAVFFFIMAKFLSDRTEWIKAVIIEKGDSSG